jgi:EAL domain-containing protein (putative c-di-GMP-specific phosphodiesterase class I)
MMTGALNTCADEQSTLAGEYVQQGSDVARAIGNREIYATFQPQFEWRSSEVAGTEVLARWRTPGGDEILANQFIPLVEETELERDLLRLMLEATAKVAQCCYSYGGTFSVNASQWLVSRQGFPAWLIGVMKELKFSPTQLIIELTERTSVSAIVAERSLQSNMQCLERDGVAFALDDFGWGGATMQALDSYGFKQVKIDKYFLHRARSAPKSLTILTGMVRIAHDTDAQVVLEGVETADDLRLAKAVGADLFQGYLVGRPCTVDQLLLSVANGIPKFSTEVGWLD